MCTRVEVHNLLFVSIFTVISKDGILYFTIKVPLYLVLLSSYYIMQCYALQCISFWNFRMP